MWQAVYTSMPGFSIHNISHIASTSMHTGATYAVGTLRRLA